MKLKLTVFLLGLVALLCLAPFASAISWSEGIPFELTAYGSTVACDSAWTFDAMVLNSSFLSFFNTSIGSGSQLSNFTVSVVGANLTMRQLSLNETYFLVSAAGNYSIVMSGFGAEPSSVLIGQSGEAGAALAYSYLVANDTIIINSALNGSKTIVFNLPSGAAMPEPSLTVIDTPDLFNALISGFEGLFDNPYYVLIMVGVFFLVLGLILWVAKRKR